MTALPDETAEPTRDRPRPALTGLDKLFVASSLPLPTGAFIGCLVAPSWQLALVVLLFALVPLCILVALRRRRAAYAMTAASDEPQVARHAAVLHLQSSGLFLLAIGVVFLAAIPWMSLY